MSLDLREEQKAIGGRVYLVRPLSTRASLRVMTRVLKMAAPGFGDVARLRDAARAATSAMGTLLSGMLSELDEGVVEFACAAFAEVSRVEMAPGKYLALSGDQWDEHFRGRLDHLFEWVKFAAEVTYGPLAERLKAELATPEAEAPTATAPPAG